MSYTTEVSDLFRSYSIILDEGIPSILALVNKGRCGSLITIQNDKSVSVSKSLGDKIIDSLDRQEELKSLFTTVNSVLDSLDHASKSLLLAYYCEHKTLTEALSAAGFKSPDALDFARAHFAFLHPNINFSKNDFTQICKDLAESAEQTVKNEICIRERFESFKNNVLSAPEEFKDLANNLEGLTSEKTNNCFLTECSSGDVKFWRRRNQLLLAMFYSSNPDVDFDIILDLLKEGQGQKKYMQRLHNKLHPELF